MRRMVTILWMLLGAGDAAAWGREGHETVGYLAAHLIQGTRAEAEVARILHAGESLASAAEWPDCAKGYCGPLDKEMTQFVQDNKHHKSYHYTDVPFQESAYIPQGIGTTPDDVVRLLRDAILVLQGRPAANPAHRLTEREALFVLAHLLGDIHQPLHVGAAYVGKNLRFYDPKTAATATSGFSEGGNWLCVGTKNLHSKWDSEFVEKAMAAASVGDSGAFANALLNGPQPPAAEPGDVLVWPQLWATESLHLAKTVLSNVKVVSKRVQGAKGSCGKPVAGTKGNMWTIALPPAYAASAAQRVPVQLQLAGRRLALVLEAIWP
jgi:hypothetical protein